VTGSGALMVSSGSTVQAPVPGATHCQPAGTGWPYVADDRTV
jgi:hypothetical protein